MPSTRGSLEPTVLSRQMLGPTIQFFSIELHRSSPFSLNHPIKKKHAYKLAYNWKKSGTHPVLYMGEILNGDFDVLM